MDSARQWLFGPFRLDPDNATLWRGEQVIALKPKTFAVLHDLVAHAGHLVTQEALFEAVWPDTAVGDAVLKVCIAEIRKALGDTVKAPRFIATVHRRGYRFIARLTAVEATVARDASPAPPALPPPGHQPGETPAGVLLEREDVLHRLQAAFDRARAGARQLVFVTGEPGIGKTAAVEAFVTQAAGDPQLWIAQGQCVEQHGPGEPYLPVLEALGQLCRESQHERLIALLRQQAPTWLVQMPWLLNDSDRQLLQHELQGTTRERMLRELAEWLETLTAEAPLILVLEDLHWSDNATLDLLTALARRREPARLLLIGTYRPADVIAHAHPLHAIKQDLQIHGCCTELPLAGLSHTAVTEYLTGRFPGHRFPPALAEWLHQHTEGNPLFVVTMVTALVGRGALEVQDGRWALPSGLDAIEIGVPESLRQMLGQQIDHLPPADQRVLEAAGVSGLIFSAAAVAVGLDEDAVGIEERCEGLAQQHILRPAGVATWPDGTVAACYEFMHALYQQVAYQRVGAGRRVQLHQRVGARLEAAYGPRTEEIAAELAEHFVRGRDARRAARYLRQAGVKAAACSAHREAVAYFERALEALTDLPESGDAREQAIDLHFDLRNALLLLGDFGRVLDHLRRAESIAKALDDRRRLGWVSAYLTHYCFVSGDYDAAIAAGQRASAIARGLGELSLDVVANYYLGETYRALSDYPRAIAFLRKGIEPLRGELVHERFGLAGLPAVLARVYLAACLAEVGEFSEGIVVAEEAMRIAQVTAQPYNLIIASTGIGRVCFRQGDFRRVVGVLETGLQHCEAYNVPRWFPEIASRLGATYALCGRTSEALSLLERAVARSSAMNLIFGHALRVAWLSESYLLAGRWGEALAHAQQALEFAQLHKAEGDRAYILRLLGNIHMQRATPEAEQAGNYLCQALALARDLGMRPLMAHCHLDLGRLEQQRKRRQQSRAELSTARELYRAMAMTFWLPQLEAKLAQVP